MCMTYLRIHPPMVVPAAHVWLHRNHVCDAAVTFVLAYLCCLPPLLFDDDAGQLSLPCTTIHVTDDVCCCVVSMGCVHVLLHERSLVDARSCTNLGAAFSCWELGSSAGPAKLQMCTNCAFCLLFATLHTRMLSHSGSFFAHPHPPRCASSIAILQPMVAGTKSESRCTPRAPL